MKDFLSGVADLFGAARWWTRRPGTMALGLIPAGIAALVLGAAIVAAALTVPALIAALTPFADTWIVFWRETFRAAVLVAVLVGALFLATSTFVALTLALGDPFYEKIWAMVETEDGGPVPEAGYGFWRGVADAASLFVRGLGASLLAALLSLVPLIGAVLGPVVGALLAGRILADELTSRALTHRGLDAERRAALTRASSARLRGFGAAAHVLMLVPLLAIVVMPTAVAGSTVLARRMLGIPAGGGGLRVASVVDGGAAVGGRAAGSDQIADAADPHP